MALQLRLQGNLSNDRFARQFLKQAAAEFPFQGESRIAISFAPSLTTRRGKLLVRAAIGTPVHAAAFLRQRKIVLETQLISKRKTLCFILLHELFHFAWLRLGNAARAEFTALIAAEAIGRARGEMGESAEVAKARWQECPKSETLWKRYVCESFCDTGANILSSQIHSLAARWRRRRLRWFKTAMPAGGWRC